MKKSLIFKILYLFLVLIVVAGASVFATNTYLSARDISYGSSNVEDALNGLFTLKGNDENYSTDEKVVGKWIDGKTIYRKVISYNNKNLSTTWVDLGIPKNNCETIIKADAITQELASVVVNISYENSDGNFHGKTLDRDYYIKYFILEYTKTTDNPTNN